MYAIRDDRNNAGTLTVAGSSQNLPTGETNSFVLGSNYCEWASVSPVGGVITITATAAAEFDVAGFQLVPVLPSGFVNALPVTTPLTIAPGAAFDLNGGNQQVAYLADAIPGLGGSVINSSTSSSVLTLSPTGTSSTFSGAIGGGSGAISLVISGSGLVTLNHANSYTGGTTISAGTLVANNNLALGTGLVAIGNANSAGNPAALLTGGPYNLGLPITVNASAGPATLGTISSSGGHPERRNHLKRQQRRHAQHAGRRHGRVQRRHHWDGNRGLDDRRAQQHRLQRVRFVRGASQRQRRDPDAYKRHARRQRADHRQRRRSGP